MHSGKKHTGTHPTAQTALPPECVEERQLALLRRHYPGRRTWETVVIGPHSCGALGSSIGGRRKWTFYYIPGRARGGSSGQLDRRLREPCRRISSGSRSDHGNGAGAEVRAGRMLFVRSLSPSRKNKAGFLDVSLCGSFLQGDRRMSWAIEPLIIIWSQRHAALRAC